MARLVQTQPFDEERLSSRSQELRALVGRLAAALRLRLIEISFTGPDTTR